MVSVAVRDAATKSLYERNVGQRLNRVQHEAVHLRRGHGRPRTYRFTTDLLAEAPVRGGKVRSDLFLRGGGDPTMLAEDYRDLAQQLRAAGVTQVQGDLVADDSFFDGVPLGRLELGRQALLRAVTSGLTVAPDTDYDSGTTIVKTSPTAVGSRAGGGAAAPHRRRADRQPGDHRRGRVRQPALRRREHASDRVVVSGTIGADAAPDTEWVTVPDPTTYAADVLARARRRGSASAVACARARHPPARPCWRRTTR